MLPPLSLPAEMRMYASSMTSIPAQPKMAMSSSVCKNVVMLPALQIKQRARRNKIEAAFRQLRAPLAHQHRIKLATQLMQVEHVICGILLLFFRQILGAPVGGLLLF